MKTNQPEPSEDTGQVIVVDTSEPIVDTSDTSSTMTDLTVGFAEMHFQQIACPACVGLPSEFDISANLKLHHPTSGTYTEHLTPVGSCTTQLIDTHVSSQPIGATQTAQFNTISLAPDGQGSWSNNYVYEYQYERNTSYEIQTEHVNIPDAFVTIEGFDSIEPYTLLWVDPSYAFDAIISKQGTSFSWYPVVSNTQFEIMVAIYSQDGSQFLGAVSCMEEDIGSMQLPGQYFQSYPTWALTAVYLSRHRIDRVAVEDLNGYLESHMQWTVIGTGHIE